MLWHNFYRGGNNSVLRRLIHLLAIYSKVFEYLLLGSDQSRVVSVLREAQATEAAWVQHVVRCAFRGSAEPVQWKNRSWGPNHDWGAGKSHGRKWLCSWSKAWVKLNQKGREEGRREFMCWHWASRETEKLWRCLGRTWSKLFVLYFQRLEWCLTQRGHPINIY